LIGSRARIDQGEKRYVSCRIGFVQGDRLKAPSPAQLAVAEVTDDAEEEGPEVRHRVDAVPVKVERDEGILEDVVLRVARTNEAPDESACGRLQPLPKAVDGRA